MSTIEIKQVSNRKELTQFVQFYYDLYRGNNYAVPYLFNEEMNTLRSDRNPSFECCDARYFMAFRNGHLVGRVAAIINRRANECWQRRQIRFGWFDFIDDQEVSKALLQAVEDWGRKEGMTELAGPLGFIDTDREGMLVEGFDQLSTMYINYNHPYYPKHPAFYYDSRKHGTCRRRRHRMSRSQPCVHGEHARLYGKAKQHEEHDHRKQLFVSCACLRV